MDRRGFFTFSAGAAALLLPSQVFAQTRNQFSGNPVAEWLPDGINMRQLEDFSYFDPDGLEWKVPGPYDTNGASIPRFLWTLAGSPFVGRYRDAALVHDYFCEAMTRSWQATHRVFYQAMLARNVDTFEAKTKYAAVRAAGPRWDGTHVWYTELKLFKRLRKKIKNAEIQPSREALAKGIVAQKFEQTQQKEFEEIKNYIELVDPTLNEIDAREQTYGFDYEEELRVAREIVDEFTIENHNGQLLAPRELVNPEELKFREDLTGLETILQRPAIGSQF